MQVREPATYNPRLVTQKTRETGTYHCHFGTFSPSPPLVVVQPMTTLVRIQAFSANDGNMVIVDDSGFVPTGAKELSRDHCAQKR